MDALECAAFGHTPKRALVLALRGSTLAWTVWRDGRPVAMMGVSPRRIIEGVGTPWLLGTDEVGRAGRLFVDTGPFVIGAMLDYYRRLENAVAAENGRAIRVLRMLGFAIEAETVVIGGVPFHRFSKGRD